MPSGVPSWAVYVYRGSLAPELSGRYLYADLCSGFVRSFKWTGAATDNLDLTPEVGAHAGVTSFGEDARGELYLVVGDGSLYRFEAGKLTDAKSLSRFVRQVILFAGLVMARPLHSQDTSFASARSGLHHRRQVPARPRSPRATSLFHHSLTATPLRHHRRGPGRRASRGRALWLLPGPGRREPSRARDVPGTDRKGAASSSSSPSPIRA